MNLGERGEVIVLLLFRRNNSLMSLLFFLSEIFCIYFVVYLGEGEVKFSYFLEKTIDFLVC